MHQAMFMACNLLRKIWLHRWHYSPASRFFCSAASRSTQVFIPSQAVSHLFSGNGHNWPYALPASGYLILFLSPAG